MGIAKLSIIDERRVRLARLAAAMAAGPPPALPKAGIELYSGEELFAVRSIRRLEYLGLDSDPPNIAFSGWGRPLFRAGNQEEVVYIGPAEEETSPPPSWEWQEEGKGKLYLTNLRLAYSRDRGSWMEFPFEAISWAGCYATGIGLQTGSWPPVGIQTAYPEWIYAFYRFLAHGEIPSVQLSSLLKEQAQMVGIQVP